MRVEDDGRAPCKPILHGNVRIKGKLLSKKSPRGSRTTFRAMTPKRQISPLTLEGSFTHEHRYMLTYGGCPVDDVDGVHDVSQGHMQITSTILNHGNLFEVVNDTPRKTTLSLCLCLRVSPLSLAGQPPIYHPRLKQLQSFIRLVNLIISPQRDLLQHR